ncbi:ABC-2 type transport system permease protein [Cohaesibacter sp. ES.047]|uniref:ABC transporter permease n=1 Tax=Cohaesibacter sp. ES.047 TaxID=1798205 RepID=UPI000BB81D69|nr:ABC transporter permease [Cohaesibacter sp. ES.047]SNY91712.1 ABC-2 type transport system permease protein [Cohaesibacter sp. ES.047]
MKSISNIGSNIFRLAVFEIRKRSLNTFIGVMWSVAAPLMQMLIIWFVMEFVFKSTQPHKFLWLVSGIGTWIVISASITKTCNSLVGRRALIQHNNVDFKGLIMADILGELFLLLPFFGLAIVGLLASGTVSLSLLLIPYMLVVLVSFIYGLGLVLAVLTPFLRDIPYLVGLALQVLFWLTPIAYAKSMIDDRVRLIIELNPLTYYVQLSQKIFLGDLFTMVDLVLPAVLSLAFVVVGTFVYNAFARKVVIYL